MGSMMPGGQGEELPATGGIGGECDLAELFRQVEADWQKTVEGLPNLEAELERQLAAVLETDLSGWVPPPLGGG